MKDKQKYTTPSIEKIKLDNQISLALESTPPYPDNESALTPEYLNNEPFRDNLA